LVFCAALSDLHSLQKHRNTLKRKLPKNGNISLVTFKSTADLKSASKTDLFREILKLSAGAELRLMKSEKDTKSN
jgi:CRISPR/Cas system-associated protein endoribonuclease Cas2